MLHTIRLSSSNWENVKFRINEENAKSLKSYGIDHNQDIVNLITYSHGDMLSRNEKHITVQSIYKLY